MINLTYIALGFLGLNTIILLCMYIQQIRKYSHDYRYSETIDGKLTELSKQNQLTEQQLRENLLLTISNLQQSLLEKLSQSRLEQHNQSADVKEQLQNVLYKGIQDNRLEIKTALTESATELGTRINQLTQTTETKLKEINLQVEKRLAEGFVKTNETFNDVIQRLALIDAAQKKITELSSNVMSLQEILNDKRSRGAFGEVQLSALIRNMIPESHFSFQHQLSNNRRPDCILFLPEPSGNIAIDAKFPLENYRLTIDSSLGEHEKLQAKRQFKIDIRKHIQDIAEKYIIPGETADGAVMFIPAEAVFAEIHAHHSDLVDIAHQANVWLVSPTTMMAILTTSRAVLKDAATRKQVHEIQKHLRLLSEDFERFQMRMDNLAKRIAQTYSDVEQVHISSKKISQRFMQIERAEISPVEMEENLEPVLE
jgi:DNA recombination protein RmuC